MARKPIAKAKTAATENRFSVEKVPLDGATDLMTIAEDDPIWTVGASDRLLRDTMKAAPRIVRLKPPPEVDDATIEAIRLKLEHAGALAVKVLPRRRAAVVPEEAKRVPVAHRTIREIVSDLVASAPTQDRERLTASVNRALSKAGL